MLDKKECRLNFIVYGLYTVGKTLPQFDNQWPCLKSLSHSHSLALFRILKDTIILALLLETSITQKEESVSFWRNVKITASLSQSILETLTREKYSFRTVHSPNASQINTFQYQHYIKETVCKLNLALPKDSGVHFQHASKSQMDDFRYKIIAWDNSICIDQSCAKEV